MKREPIELALFTKLRDGLDDSFTTIGRRHVMPPELTPDMQPAAFLQGTGEDKAAGPRGLPGRLTLQFYLFIYCVDDSPRDLSDADAAVFSTELNAIKDAIDDALKPDASTGFQDLGLPDSVSHCWIEGETAQDPGIFGNQAFLMIPIKVLTL